MEMFKNTHVVIMAGGGGTRFWPVSRNAFPKQFLKLLEGKSMLRHTVERIMPLVSADNIWILTNQLYEQLIQQDIPEVPSQNIIVEPIRRDTSGAIMLATSIISALDPEATMFIMPADHIIKPVNIFEQTLSAAKEYITMNNGLFTFGIPPTFPSPQFGYINAEDETATQNIFYVRKFVEKPTIEIAKTYLETKKYYWNSGIFAWKTNTIKNKFAELLPVHYEGIVKLQKSWGGSTWQEDVGNVFSAIPSISIDYGIMEKSKDVVMLKTDFSWDDVGAWEALQNLYPGDENVVVGRHVGIDTNNCIFYSEDQLIATIGIDNLVVVATNDSVLVVPKNQTARVKEIVALLDKKGYQKYL